jgi:hypothetical protein
MLNQLTKQNSLYEPLRRILSNERIEAVLSKAKIRKTDSESGNSVDTISITKLTPSQFQPFMIISIDGGYNKVEVENGFPGAEMGYVTIASVLTWVDKIKELEKELFIDPKKFRETEKTESLDAVFTGCNVVLEGEGSAQASMRKSLYEELKQKTIFAGTETLLETYEHLLKIKLDKGHKGKSAQCPYDNCEGEFTYGYGEYKCPSCDQKLYSTDALRLHELLKPAGTSGEMYGQIMQTFKRLQLIHILRAFEKKNWLASLRDAAILMEGALAVFSTSSWLAKSIINELNRINIEAKKFSNQDLLILGMESTGNFATHFEQVDTTKDGMADNFPSQSALLLTDEYIKKNIIFSEGSDKTFGQDTYFGRKFLYKTSSGHRLVPTVAFFNDEQADIKTANPEQFPRLADVMNLLDKFVSSQYQNSLAPLVAAHGEASIPLNLGRKIFDDIAKKVRDQN